MKLTAEQKSKLIDQILTTQHVMESRPNNPNGTKDFTKTPIPMPLTRDDVVYLVDRYAAMREANVDHNSAARLTYGCCYRQSDIRFNPHARIAELKNE